MDLYLQKRRIRVDARVQETSDPPRASDVLIVMLATLSVAAGLLYLIATLFPALAV
ncbi:hypothetical protein OSH11_07455 [Kaistia dalseonensis]|uniref:Uncharacterized protein n=1 Tax=Kaistia dalseonensis TaxID=410840 RepID=A0ABU0H6L9_9HYPH|nr:hypothetical protein [Kaistia dalseonensis]MCX5494532.1 hypothetical protein [Kaistia dalseonensis]MDQ0437111.1 hypothetical protein [Kaistia dalseonensis]